MNSYPLKNKISSLLMTLSVLTFSFYGTNALARDYYVSPNGDNSGLGTIDNPFKTISKASDLAIAGDKVIIRTGIYEERVIPKHSGNIGHPIVYMAYPKEKVIIDGSRVAVPYWGGLFDVSSKSYLKILGLSVKNSKYIGIFGDHANNIVVQNCHTYNTVSSGIGLFFGKNIAIRANEVALANTTGNQENITVEDIENFVISYNHVHDGGKSKIGGEGIDAKGDSRNGKIFSNRVHGLNRQGIYVDAYSGKLADVHVYNNTVYSNASDGITVGNEASGHLDNVYVYNNVVFNNKWSGIKIWGGGQPGNTHAMENVYIFNNTVTKNGWIPWAAGIATDNDQVANLVILNNLISQNTGIQIQIIPTLASSHTRIQNNLIDNSNRNWRLQGSGDTLGENAVNALPGFVDTKHNNYKLAASSPAIGNGLTNLNIPAFVIREAALSNSAEIDIGAFQWHPAIK